MEDKMMIPYIVYEGEQARNERNIKRLVVALVVTIMLLFASNAVWIYAWMQYDYTDEEVTTTHYVEAKDGVANYIGNDGDIVNGSDTSCTRRRRSCLSICRSDAAYFF